MPRSVIQFELPHLELFTPQPEQVVGHRMTIEGAPDASVLGNSFTVLNDLDIRATVGIFEGEPGRAFGWALIADTADRYDILYTIRQINDFLVACDKQGVYKTVEIVVRERFCAGNRFARVLGFKKIQTLAGMGLEGEDLALYVRKP